MSEFIQKASKEANEKGITDKLYHIANQLWKGREVSHHEAVMRCLSMPSEVLKFQSNLLQLISKKTERVIEQRSVLETMEDDDLHDNHS